MNAVHRVLRYLKEPAYRFDVNEHLGLYNHLSDEAYTIRQYKLRTGRTLDLTSPETFNEKLQWLKLYDRKPVYTTMVDKYAVKDFLARRIGKEHIVPLLGVWERFDEIPFDALPDQFVLKTTHGSSGMAVCRDKSRFDRAAMKAKFDKALKRNYYLHCREWPYKDVKPRIIAERYMQDGDTENLNVYRVFNFSGVPTIVQTVQNDKQPNKTIDFFDTAWNLLDLRQNYPNSARPLARPKTLDTMLRLSALCSEGFPFLRTDWYEVNGEVYFSEFTFYTSAGYQPFHPDDWNLKLGSLINLPSRKAP